MEEMLIKDYIDSFQRREFSKIVKRELETKFIEEKAISIIGPRRTGKTYYFFQKISELQRNKVLYLDFEEPFLSNLNPNEVLKIVYEIFPQVTGNVPSYIFLDEIQNLKDWEKLVRSLLNKGIKVAITGSSSKLLSKEIATHLRGRTISYFLLPFSFREFLKAKNFEINLNSLENIGKIKKTLEEYLEIGGFPEIVLKEEKEKILKEYIDLAFFKDFVERHNIKNIKLARLIFEHLIQNFSKYFSVRSMEKYLKSIGATFNLLTLYKYVESLEDTLFVFFVKRYSIKARERESWPRKVYVCDVGLTRKIRYFEDFGKKMENLVFLNLLRKINEKPLMEIFCLKIDDKEVDFLVKEGLSIKQLIQVTYASSKDEIKEDVKSLLKAFELFKEHKPELLIITWDYEDTLKENNKEIKCLPLWKWLLGIK